jgi:hypothetical protein
MRGTLRFMENQTNSPIRRQTHREPDDEATEKIPMAAGRHAINRSFRLMKRVVKLGCKGMKLILSAHCQQFKICDLGKSAGLALRIRCLHVHKMMRLVV